MGFFSGYGRSNPNAQVSGMMLRGVAAEEAARKNAMQRGWRMYYGDLQRVLRVKPNQPDDNILMNFGRLVVDKSVSFLFGEKIEFTVEDGASDSAADQWLGAAWKWNRQQSLLHRLGVNGGVTGQVFVRIAMSEGQPYPRLVVLDPSTVSVLWNPEDYEEVVEYRVEWNAVSPLDGKAVAYRQVITRDESQWRIFDQCCRDGRHWENVREPVLWPFVWSPVFTCQNLPAPNSFWGLADINEDVVRIQNARNFVASNMARILRYHAHPKTYATGVPAADLQLGVDDIAFLSNPNAVLKNLEMQGDLASSLEYLRYLDDQLLSLASVPPISLGKVEGSGSLSGVALRLHYQPLLERNGTKRMLYGDMLNVLNAALLELGGFGAGRRCGVVWSEPLPFDVNEAMLAHELGVASRDTLAARLGYDYALEEPKIAAEMEASKEAAARAFDGGNLPNPYPTGGQ